jgi:hypothetical protein
MAAIGTMKLRVLMQVDGSPVQNEVGTIEVDVRMRPLDRSVDTEAAAEATMVADLDLPGALRAMADQIEAGDG